MFTDRSGTRTGVTSSARNVPEDSTSELIGLASPSVSAAVSGRSNTISRAGQRLAVRQNGVPYHLDTDHLGSTSLVTVAGGGEVGRQK